MRSVSEISVKEATRKPEPLLRILILEDIPADTELVLNELKEADLNYELAICRTEEEFTAQRTSFQPSVVLTPYSLSYTNAVKALKHAREEGCSAPFILLAQDLSEDIAIELLKTGIEDYVLRSSLKRLPIAIKKALLKDHTQRELQLSKDMVKASKASLINMVRNMPMAVAMFDADLKYIVVSEQWLKEEGFTEKDLIGKNHYQVNPNLPEHWKQIHQECLQGATKAVEKEKVTRPNGTESYMRWKINPWYSPDGKIGGIVLFIEDITAKVLAEEAIRSNERSLSMAQKVGNIGSFEIDLETRQLSWSDQMFHIFGIEKQPISYDTVDQFIHPDDRDFFEKETAKRAETGQPERVDYRIITPEGEIKYIQSRAKLIPATQENASKLVGIVQDMTAQQLMAEEVKQNADRLALALAASNLGVWEWNNKTQRAYFDDRCRTILGSPEPSPETHEELSKLLHPEDRDSFLARIAQCISEKRKLNEDVRVIQKNGECRYINIKSDFGNNKNGSHQSIYGVIRDLTKRKLAEEKIAENELIFRQLAENITEVFYLTDIETNKVLFISETYKQLYGSSVDELYEDSRSWSKRIHPEDRERIIAEYTTTARSGKYDTEYRILLDSGEIKWVHDRAFPITNTEGKVVRIAGIAEDITQRVANEQQIRMLSQVASETVNGVLIQDKEGKIEWMNQAFCDITGYEVESAIGKEPWSFLTGPDTDQNLVTLTYESMKRKKAFQSENKLYKPDGTAVWVSVNFTPIMDASGELSRIVSIGMDITHIKEQEIMQADTLLDLESKVQERTKLLEDANRQLLDEMKARELVSSLLSSNHNDLQQNVLTAKHLLTTILPSETDMKDRFANAFAVSKPKNEVGGDFHWVHQNNTHTMIAIVDCTGHGISGALMSVVGFTFLNQVANMDNDNDPSVILGKLDHLMNQKNKETQVMGGIDIGLCVIENDTLEMNFAGAMNEIFRVDGATVEILSGNRKSVGLPTPSNESTSFETHSRQLRHGDKLYFTTNGLLHQFGGSEGKKYSKAQFQQFLQQLQSFDFSDHGSKIEKEFSLWKGSLPQVDDVLVVGIKI